MYLFSLGYMYNLREKCILHSEVQLKLFFLIKTAKVIDHNTNLFPNKNGQLVGLRFFSTKSKTTSGIPVKTGGRPSLVFFFFYLLSGLRLPEYQIKGQVEK